MGNVHNELIFITDSSARYSAENLSQKILHPCGDGGTAISRAKLRRLY
jgi:hypothetical protein